jgi:hypothetical protein
VAGSGWSQGRVVNGVAAGGGQSRVNGEHEAKVKMNRGSSGDAHA